MVLLVDVSVGSAASSLRSRNSSAVRLMIWPAEGTTERAQATRVMQYCFR
jgi:hypothetical protein